MNTEIFDYLKALSKKDFFFANFFSSVLSVIIIIAGLISVTSGTSILLYTIMFGCATCVLVLNAYKCYKRGSKNGVVFAIAALVMGAITVIGLIAMANGGV